MTDRYAVVCAHPELDTRAFVADIDDDRRNGGAVRLGLWRGGVGTRVEANKRGSRRSIALRCGVCPLNVELSETSVADLLDEIAPRRDMLPVDDEQRHVIAFKTLCDINGRLRDRT